MRERFPEIFQLSPDEKCQLIQELAADLADQVDNAPVPEWVFQELDRRHAKYLADPTSGLTWEQVKASILARNTCKTDEPA